MQDHGPSPLPRRHDRPRFGGAPHLPDDIIDQLLARPRADDDQWDPRLAYLLAIAAGWAYSDAATLREKLSYYGLPGATVQPMSVVNEAMLIVAHGFFIRSACGRFGVLAFRGTEPTHMMNWLTNAEVVWRELDDGRVHAGFFGNVEALWRAILEQVGAARNDIEGAPLRDLYVTGHSLGGAMAVLAARRLLDVDLTGGGGGAAHLVEGAAPLAGLLRGVYTYGQPMVGDRAFATATAARLKGRYFRHVYQRDVVCRMPPRIVDRDFVHFGQARRCVFPGKTWRPAASSEPRPPLFITPMLLGAGAAFFARRLSPLRKLRLAYSLDDHVPTNYVVTSRASLDPLP